ncbi:hypothetical protein ALC57_07357 [Trachymyrmex cornetzi]|uniref:Uncharacterized protein n=1 Tax=Trachymyrmex cornetzi TaxID=471704 RepID=A0A195E6F2_9HYME|nr:hypothetical protein ALC57_07357 [Trachymyrmex cornetzi]
MVAERYASHSAIADHRPGGAGAVPVRVHCAATAVRGSDSRFVVATSAYLRELGRERANRNSLGVTTARSLIRHRGRVLVGDVIVTGMERRDGGEGGATERGWWRVSLPLCEDSGLSCQVQLRWSR